MLELPVERLHVLEVPAAVDIAEATMQAAHRRVSRKRQLISCRSANSYALGVAVPETIAACHVKVSRLIGRYRYCECFAIYCNRKLGVSHLNYKSPIDF